MKILAISGCNIASFEGEFTLEFEQPPLQFASLFAITGPTGSGKSTILDTLCLALFDRAPRYAEQRTQKMGPDDLSQRDSRNLLRRGCPIAWAKVRFLNGQNQRFEATWSVKRAGKKGRGKIQQVEMCLQDLTTGAILSEKKTDALSKIEATLGMDFDQFRRSVLLAQGEFAAFLHAAPADRGKLLETITGTEIFAQISAAIYQHTKALEAQNQEQLRQLASIEPLPAEERLALESTLEQTRQEIERIQEKEREFRQVQREILQRKHLQELVDQAQESFETLNAQWTQSASQREQLAQRRSLQDIHATWVRWQTLSSESAKWQSSIPELETQIKQMEVNEKAIQTTLQETDAALLQLKKDWQEAEPKRQQANYLESQITEAEKRIANKTPELESLKAKTQKIQVELAGHKFEQRKLQQASDLCGEWAHQHAVAEQWQLHRSALSDAFNDWQRAQARTTTLKKEIEQLSQKEDSFNLDLNRYHQKISELLSQKENLVYQLDSCTAQLESWNASNISAQLEGAQAEWKQLNWIHEQLKSLQQFEATFTELSAEKIELEEQLALKVQRIQALQQDLPLLEVRIKEAEWALRHAQSMLDLVHYRHALKANQPCPLCGSREHPFAEAAPVNPLAEQENRLASLREAWQRQSGELKVSLNQQHYEQKSKEKLENRLGELQTQIDHLQNNLAPHAAQWAQTVRDLEQVQTKIEKLQAQMRNQENLLAQKMKWESALRKIEEELAKNRKELDSISLKQAEVENQKIQKQTEHTLATEAAKSSSQTWQKYAASSQEPNEKAQQEILKMSQQWQENQNRLTYLKSQMAERTQLCALTEQRQQQAQSDEKALSHELEELNSGMQQNRADLQLLLGGKTLGQFTSEFEQKREQLQSEKAQQFDQLKDLQINRAHCQSSLYDLCQRVASAKLETDQLKQHISDRLSSENMSWEQAKALLDWPVERFKKLEMEMQSLESAFRSSSDVFEDRKSHLATHQAQHADLPSEDHVIAAMEKIRSELDQHNQNLVSAQMALAADNQKHEQKAKIEEQQAAWRKEYETASELNSHIGSASGNKFRQFAQQLTLEQLVMESNRHLNQLAPRYHLKTVAQANLELEIVDRFMADANRSISSLSGGETFLVSLALALGLSDLTAAKTHVGSLFIDEGFGALDLETLDQALSVLEGLQEQGRQIGIISHVEGLAERLGTTVRVVKVGAHQSRLEIIS
ncbi:MAG: AAA family ATPase [Acidobacteria bacterium]|nr:AAA family ATPase [Acidobacteriota bacterium]